MPLRHSIPFVMTLLLAACDAAPPSPSATSASATSAPTHPATVAAATPAPHAANQLRLTVDGKTWQADREFFGTWHPPGLDRAVLMAASRGPKDKHEQTFNLNLTGVDGPGHYVVRGTTSNPTGAVGSAIQLANLSEQRYLIGGPFGYDVEVELLQAGAGIIEAKFHGRVTANDGSELRLIDGYFFCRE